MSTQRQVPSPADLQSQPRDPVPDVATVSAALIDHWTAEIVASGGEPVTVEVEGSDGAHAAIGAMGDAGWLVEVEPIGGIQLRLTISEHPAAGLARHGLSYELGRDVRIGDEVFAGVPAGDRPRLTNSRAPVSLGRVRARLAGGVVTTGPAVLFDPGEWVIVRRRLPRVMTPSRVGIGDELVASGDGLPARTLEEVAEFAEVLGRVAKVVACHRVTLEDGTEYVVDGDVVICRGA
jgi:hypothetical protein